MKARPCIDRHYRRLVADQAFERHMEWFVRQLGTTRAGLSAALKADRAIRFAAGRQSKIDRLMRDIELRRETQLHRGGHSNG